MPDPIDTSTLYEDAREFLADLGRNNDCGWFARNKDRYDSLLKRPAERLLADLAPALEDSIGQKVRRKLFRPHRDLRFSEDKTPYHTHLHAMWSLPDGRAWVFGLSPDYATAGAGIMHFSADQATAWGTAIASPAGETLDAALKTGRWRIDPPSLDAVPQPWPKDHIRADLLRRDGLVVWRDGLDTALQADPLRALQETFAEMAPVQRWLERIV